MGRIFFFLIGFILSFLKMLLGSVVICGIVGYFFPTALYVLIPLFLITIIVESFKDGIQRSREYGLDRKERKYINRLRKAFKEDEMYEFDQAWRQMSR